MVHSEEGPSVDSPATTAERRANSVDSEMLATSGLSNVRPRSGSDTSASGVSGPMVKDQNRNMREGGLFAIVPAIESEGDMIKREQRLRAAIRFLDALVRWGETSTDVIPDDVTSKYPDGGKWVGQIPCELLRDGIIVELKTIRSVRPARHRGKIGLFRAADPATVMKQLAWLKLQLDALRNTTKRPGE